MPPPPRRKLSPADLDKLAARLMKAKTAAEARRIRERIIVGFYGVRALRKKR